LVIERKKNKALKRIMHEVGGISAKLVPHLLPPPSLLLPKVLFTIG